MTSSVLRRRGLQSVLLAAFLFGLSTPLAKPLLDKVAPQLLAGLFYFGSGFVVLLGPVFRRPMMTEEQSLASSDISWLAGAILFGGVIAPTLMLEGLQLTPASNASLLLNLEGVFTVLLARVVFHERVDRRFAIGTTVVILGSVLVSWNGVTVAVQLIGPIAITVACLCWGVDNNLLQKVSARNPFQVAAAKGFSAGAFNLFLGIWLANHWPAAVWVSAGLLIGFICYVVLPALEGKHVN